MSNYNHCNTCVSNKEYCNKCCDNPIYRDVPKTSMYQEYIPTCPRGYEDCVNDPAYVKYHDPEWYTEMYGDLTPEQVSERLCKKKVEEDPNEEYYCYDDEDK